jgi:hypothetical protein
LLDLKPEKELQLFHHCHFEFHTHVFCKHCNQRVRGSAKDNIIYIHLNNQDIITLPKRKRVWSTFLFSKL